MPAKRPPDPARRDRPGTERAILNAAGQVLAEEGFAAFGVNAIARAAGCDKQLIYRYFGGLEGLADAMGAELAETMTAELAKTPRPPKEAGYGALMAALALAWLDLLRRDRVLQQIAAWEIAAPSEIVARMAAARGRRLGAWMMEMRGDLAPPEGVDAPAQNALVIAAVQHVALAGAASGAFSGVPLKSKADWARIRSAVVALTEALYA